jgi:acyl-CoA reductase-like NAD-dependent aldehyde dehydrogenase
MKPELVTISPIDGSKLLRRPCLDGAALQAALEAARDAQAAWRAVPVAERALAVGRGVDAFVAMKDRIAKEITLQMGRPIRHAPAEVDAFAARARYMMRIAEDALADLTPAPMVGATRFIRREPLGVVLVVATWCYPLLTAVNAVVAALMAGNAVILKPSAQTPMAGERIAEALCGALPAGLLQCVHTDHEGTLALVASPSVDGVCFTGSAAAGAAVERAAAGRFIPVGLALGGNDAAYVRADAGLDAAVAALVDGAFFNSGQSGCGIQRIYVERTLYPEFVDKAVLLARRHVLGNPLEAATTLGPLADIAAADAVRSTIADAVAKGARPLIEEERFPLDQPGSAYVAPQILIGVHHGMALMAEECFGPVVAVMPVDADDDAVALMNDSRYGLTACIFTQDESVALALGDRLQAGTVLMNRCGHVDPALAWSGVRHSGRGAVLSPIAYEQLTRPKSFCFELT